MKIRISTRTTSTACEDLQIKEPSQITTNVIKSLNGFNRFFSGTPYEKHFDKGLYKKVYTNGEYETITIHIFKSKKEMNSFVLSSGIEMA